MYNADLKEKYMSTLSGDGLKGAVLVFNKTEETEGKLQKDLSDFTRDEGILCLRAFHSGDITYLCRIKEIIIKYIAWCHKDTGCFELSISEISANCLYISEYYELIQIRNIVKKFRNPIDRALCAAPFFGFSGDDDYLDYTSVNKDNLSLQEKEIYLCGRTIYAERWFIQDVYDTLNETEYMQDNGIKYTILGKGIAKFKANSSSANHVDMLVRNKFSRLFQVKVGDEDLTLKKVFMSGVIQAGKDVMAETEEYDINKLYDLPMFQERVIKAFKIKPYKSNFVRKYRELIKL